MSNFVIDLRGIVPQRHTMPSQGELDSMARRRYQHPPVQQTATEDKKARRWYFRARIDALTGADQIGRVEKRLYLGDVSEMTKRQAEQRRDQILQEAINRPDVMLSSQVLFGQVLDRWLATVDVREGTLAGYRSIVDAHLRPQWGNARMCDITPIAFEDWLIAKAREGSKAMCDNIRLRFTQVWKRAIFWKFTREVCPTLGMLKPKRFGRPANEKKLPTREQFQHMLYLLDEPYRSIVVVCAFTGTRISEAMALTTAQLNSESATLTEAVTMPRNRITPLKAKHSYRVIPMRHLRGDINIPEGSKPEDRPFNVGYFPAYVAIKEAAKLAGIDHRGFGAHAFRRMHNTLFRQSAESADATKLAMQQLGHGDAATNDMYYVPDATDIRRRAQIAEAMREKVMEERVN